MGRSAKAVILGLLTGFVGLVVSILPFGLWLEEDLGLALLFRIRGPRAVPPEVVVVGIDKRSASHLNLPARPEKWPRSVHARAIDRLVRAGAAVIALDIFFDEARDRADDELAAAIKRARNVVLVESLRRELIDVPGAGRSVASHLTIEQLVAPTAALAEGAAALAPFPLPTVPAKLSQYWKFKAGAGGVPTLPVVAFQLFAFDVHDEFIRILTSVAPAQVGKLPVSPEALLARGQVERLARTVREMFATDSTIAGRMLAEAMRSRGPPSDEQRRRKLVSLVKLYQGHDSEYLNFYGPPGTIPTVGYHQLIQSDPTAPLPDLRGKAVFIGSLEQPDSFYTVYSQPTGVDLSGVEIAATAFGNLLEEAPLRPLGWGWHVALLLLWGAAMGAMCCLLSAPVGALSAAGAGVLYLLATAHRFSSAGEWYPLLSPLLVEVPVAFVGSLAWKYIDTRAAFRDFLPRWAAERVLRDPAAAGQISETVWAACLLTDVKEYTEVAAKARPADLHMLVNRYFEKICEPAVLGHGGEVYDTAGDSMLAAWANPHRDKVSTPSACLAACKVKAAVERFNEGVAENLKMPTRIGLHLGQVQRGSVHAGRRHWRLVGAAVNTTERIEERVNKELGTWIAASAEVLEGVGGFLTRELGWFSLGSTSGPLLVHEVICQDHEADAPRRRLCEIFLHALRLFRDRRFEDARRLFLEADKCVDGDGPARYYAEWCAWYASHPDEWNGGVVDLTSAKPPPWGRERTPEAAAHPAAR